MFEIISQESFTSEKHKTCEVVLLTILQVRWTHNRIDMVSFSLTDLLPTTNGGGLDVPPPIAAIYQKESPPEEGSLEIVKWKR